MDFFTWEESDDIRNGLTCGFDSDILEGLDDILLSRGHLHGLGIWAFWKGRGMHARSESEIWDIILR